MYFSYSLCIVFLLFLCCERVRLRVMEAHPNMRTVCVAKTPHISCRDFSFCFYIIFFTHIKHIHDKNKTKNSKQQNKKKNELYLC